MILTYSIPVDINEKCSVVSIELDKLCKWFQVNKLSLNTQKTNFVFTNKSCDDTYSICMNGLNLSRVFVTRLLGVHMDSKLDLNDHINIVRNKIAKNVSVMNRVKHVLTSSALYSLDCTLIMPYLIIVVKFGVIITKPVSNHCLFYRKKLL